MNKRSTPKSAFEAIDRRNDELAEILNVVWMVIMSTMIRFDHS